PGPTGYYRTDPRADGTIPYFDGLYATSHHRRHAEADEHVSSWPGTPAAPTPTVPYVNRTAPETRHRSHAGARPDAAAPQAGVSLVRHTRQDHHEVSRGSAMTPPRTPRESGSSLPTMPCLPTASWRGQLAHKVGSARSARPCNLVALRSLRAIS